MTRLCVCLSGQLRGDDAALASLARQLQGLDATVVVSVWDRFGGKVDGSVNVDHLPRLFTPAVCDAVPLAWLGGHRFWESLPRLHAERRAMFEGDGDGKGAAEAVRAQVLRHFPQAVLDIEPADALALAFDQPKEDRNSLRMLYRIWRANELKRGLERRAGRPFDAVLRLRPDLFLKALDLPAIVSAAERGVVLVNAFVAGGSFVGDSLAAGSSAAIDRYAALFGRAVADPAGWDFIHHELHHHLVREGLAYEAYPAVGELAIDERLGAARVAASLAGMQAEAHPAWSPLHGLTLGVMQAAAQREAGDPAAALATLHGLAPAGQWPAEALDGWFATAGAALLGLGRSAEALACLLVCWRLRRAHLHGLPAREFDTVVQALAGVPAAAVGEGDPAAPRLWPLVEDEGLRGWLAAGLAQVGPGLPAPAVLEVLAGEAWRGARTCRAVMNRLVADNRLGDLLRRPALFDYPGALDEADVVRLHAQLRAFAGDRHGARLLMQRWAVLAPEADEPRQWLAAQAATEPAN